MKAKERKIGDKEEESKEEKRNSRAGTSSKKYSVVRSEREKCLQPRGKVCARTNLL